MHPIKSALLCMVLLSTGCAALVIGGAAAVGGGYTYTAGLLKGTYNFNLEATYKATITGVESLRLPVLNPEKGLSSASVSTKDGERDVWITLREQSSTTTEVSVRVGYFGDEIVSKRIHDAIRMQLQGTVAQ